MNEAKREEKYVWRKGRKMDGWGERVKEQEMSDWRDEKGVERQKGVEGRKEEVMRMEGGQDEGEELDGAKSRKRREGERKRER